MKRFAWALAASLALPTVVVLAGCNGEKKAGGVPTIGFAQFTSTPSLDDAREGFLAALKESGYEDGKTVNVSLQNAQGDNGTLMLMLQKFQQDGVDLVATASTPALQAAVRTIKDRPVVFCAVVDPVKAGGAVALDKGKPNITGISNPFPIDKGVELLKECMPSAKVIGSLFDPGEPFSETQLAEAKATAERLGMQWQSVAVTQSSDIASGMAALKARGVEAVLQLPSNTVNQGVEGQVKEARKQGLPIFSVQTDQIAKGVIAAIGVDIREAGYEAGKIAAEVLKGKKPGEIPLRPCTKMPLMVSEANAKAFGLTLPTAVIERAAKK